MAAAGHVIRKINGHISFVTSDARPLLARTNHGQPASHHNFRQPFYGGLKFVGSVPSRTNGPKFGEAIAASHSIFCASQKNFTMYLEHVHKLFISILMLQCGKEIECDIIQEC